MVKSFYQKHVGDGGKQSLKIFQEQVPDLMRKWPVLKFVDTYESVTGDNLDELRVLNDEFIKTYRKLWSAGETYDLPKTYKWSVDDYRNVDSAKPADIMVTNDTFRWGNRPRRLQQGLHSRIIDTSNEGMSVGRSLSQGTSGYDMAKFYDNADRAYTNSNTLDAGPTGDSYLDSNLNLL